MSTSLEAELDELIGLEYANRLAVYESYLPTDGGMSHGQRRFHEDPSKNRCLRCANKTGKTFATGAEVWWFTTGTHPFREEAKCPCTVLYVVADMENAYADDVCRRLRETEPPGVLHPDCSYDTVRGYHVGQKRGILLRNGSQVIFRSGEQYGGALAGVSADVVIVNEPPREELWGEIVRAAGEKNAPIILAFTPAEHRGKGGLRWLRCIVDGDPDTGAPPTGRWSQHVIKLTPEDVPYRSAEFITQQRENIPAWEWQQRAEGAWDSVNSKRRLAAWANTLVVGDDVKPAEGWQPRQRIFIILAADHGEKAGASAWGLFAYQVDRSVPNTVITRIRMLAEYVSSTATDEREDAVAVQAMVNSVGLSLADIDWAVGDINSSGKSRGGRALNEVMTEQFALLMRLHPLAPAFQMGRAIKGAGSVDLGLKRLNQYMARGDFRVNDRCKRAIRAFGTWEGEADEQEHVIDMTRYAVTSIEHNLDYGV